MYAESFVLVFLQTVTIITHIVFVFCFFLVIFYVSKFKFNSNYIIQNAIFNCTCIWSNNYFHSLLIHSGFQFSLVTIFDSICSSLSFCSVMHFFHSHNFLSWNFTIKNVFFFSFKQHKSERFQFDWEYTTDVKNWITGFIDMKRNLISTNKHESTTLQNVYLLKSLFLSTFLIMRIDCVNCFVQCATEEKQNILYKCIAVISHEFSHLQWRGEDIKIFKK